jgi:hypothetical protein
MAQAGQDLSFAFKCLSICLIVKQGLFDGNIDAQAEVARSIDRPHTSLGNLGYDAITTL